MIARHARCEFERLTADLEAHSVAGVERQAHGGRPVAELRLRPAVQPDQFQPAGVAGVRGPRHQDHRHFYRWSALPYIFKFLWAPLLDRYLPPILGRRRGWILIFQVVPRGLPSASWAFARRRKSCTCSAALAVLVAFLSASQDIVIDAYRVDTIPVERARHWPPPPSHSATARPPCWPAPCWC